MVSELKSLKDQIVSMIPSQASTLTFREKRIIQERNLSIDDNRNMGVRISIAKPDKGSAILLKVDNNLGGHVYVHGVDINDQLPNMVSKAIDSICKLQVRDSTGTADDYEKQTGDLVYIHDTKRGNSKGNLIWYEKSMGQFNLLDPFECSDLGQGKLKLTHSRMLSEVSSIFDEQERSDDRTALNAAEKLLDIGLEVIKREYPDGALESTMLSVAFPLGIATIDAIELKDEGIINQLGELAEAAKEFSSKPSEETAKILLDKVATLPRNLELSQTLAIVYSKKTIASTIARSDNYDRNKDYVFSLIREIMDGQSLAGILECLGTEPQWGYQRHLANIQNIDYNRFGEFIGFLENNKVFDAFIAKLKRELSSQDAKRRGLYDFYRAFILAGERNGCNAVSRISTQIE